MKSKTKTLIEAMQILANEIHSEDGVANMAIFEASERLDEQQKRIKELEQELQKSTDQNDLILDEFIRVKLITSNTEIHQLCERAHVRMRQNVPVIERNHRMEKRVAELEQAQPKWISADDELPKESGRFWCYVKCVGDLCFYFEQDNCSYNLQEKRWNSEVWGGRSEFVTHWMPLPQPPEVKP